MTILIADDHPVYREGLERVLGAAHNCTLVGMAGDGKTALDLILRKNPDVAVLDISMPGMSGLEVAKAALQHEECSTEFIILTMYKEEAYFNEAMDLGVRGYLLKENAPGEIVSCVQSVADGMPFVSSQLSHFLVKRIKRIIPPERNRSSIESLTAAERRVLQRLSQNKTSREIASELSVSIRTVQNHRASICMKLGLQGYNRLLQFAFEHKNEL